MADLTITRGEVELATETFGHSSDPALLLIMGAMASMLWWPEEFCKQLAAQGRFVIRYDNRDTGLSTTYPPGSTHYTLSDMAEDAVAILDGHGIKAADIAGMSLGGFIAQRVALAHSDRVRTLTILSSSPLGIEGLPPFTEAYSAHAATGETVDWTDRADVLDFMMRDVSMIASTTHPHDAGAARLFVERTWIAPALSRAPPTTSCSKTETAISARLRPIYAFPSSSFMEPPTRSFRSPMARLWRTTSAARSCNASRAAAMNCIRTTGRR